MKTKPAPESVSVIDTSKMSPEQRAALEMTEAAREAAHESFPGGLFMGRFDFAALHPDRARPRLSVGGQNFEREPRHAGQNPYTTLNREMESVSTFPAGGLLS